MEENGLLVSNKELFYVAKFLKFTQLVNVEYEFPISKKLQNEEFDDVKKTLHQKKLLKINSKGEISLDKRLSDCAAFCAQPDTCGFADKDGFYASVYTRGNACMLLERVGEEENTARWFDGRESARAYISQKLETSAKGNMANGAE